MLPSQLSLTLGEHLRGQRTRRPLGRGPTLSPNRRNPLEWYALCRSGCSQGPKMDILVADDDRIGRFLLNSALRELGHSVTEARMDVMPGKLGNASATS